MIKSMRILSAACALAIAGSAAAHHSYAAFDKSKTLTLKGTVVEWQWTNPHVFLILMTSGPGGKPSKIELEGASPSFLAQIGFQRKSMVPGDKVTVQIHPHRQRQDLAQLRGVTLANGKSIYIDLRNPNAR